MNDSPIDPEFDSVALITVDTQCDVLDGGAFPIEGTSDALPAMQLLTRTFRDAGRPVVHIVRLYEPDGSNAELCRRELLARGARVVVRDTPGAQLAGALLPDPELRLDSELLLDGLPQRLGPDEVAIYRPRWGAFYMTPLEQHLRERGVTTLVFAGCNFPNCPRTSIYEASERDFRIVVVRDALSGLYDRGEQELVGIGVSLMSSDEVAAAIRANPRRSVSTAEIA